MGDNLTDTGTERQEDSVLHEPIDIDPLYYSSIGGWCLSVFLSLGAMGGSPGTHIPAPT